VVTLTTELASLQATAAQQALQAANTSAAANNSSSSSLSDVSLLTGVPYGLKDLMSVPGYPTSWGLTQLKNRTINTVRANCYRMWR
jgi:Asp-tRNA(Asn)/Glu-tRNA(Gln) amidotransferase A subunit family amidase